MPNRHMLTLTECCWSWEPVWFLGSRKGFVMRHKTQVWFGHEESLSYFLSFQNTGRRAATGPVINQKLFSKWCLDRFQKLQQTELILASHLPVWGQLGRSELLVLGQTHGIHLSVWQTTSPKDAENSASESSSAIWACCPTWTTKFCLAIGVAAG